MFWDDEEKNDRDLENSQPTASEDDLKNDQEVSLNDSKNDDIKKEQSTTQEDLIQESKALDDERIENSTDDIQLEKSEDFDSDDEKLDLERDQSASEGIDSENIISEEQNSFSEQDQNFTESDVAEISLSGQDDIDALFGESSAASESPIENKELTLDQILSQEDASKTVAIDNIEEMEEKELDPDELLALAWEKSMQESVGASLNLDALLSDSPSIGGNGLKELDQSEIDSLLGFGSVAQDPKSLTGIDAILNKTLIYYERLPMMEVVFDRLLRLLSTSLRNFTSDNVEISLESMKTTRFGDYLNSIPLPAMIGVFKALEWDNSGILVVDSSLIYSIVDVLLGGRRSITAARVEGRPYTTIERNLIEKLMTVFLEELKSAFEPVSEVNFKFERLEINPHFAMISRSTNAGILVRLHIEIDDRGGRMSMMLPYATIEPIRELLLQNFMGEKFGRDSIWEQHLASQLWETEVDFNVRLDTATLPLGEILNWKAGDHLDLSVTPTSLVSAMSGEHELFKGYVGQKNGKVALKIEDNLLQKKIKSMAS